MNEQQLAAVKQALELMHNRGDVGVDEWVAAEAAIKQVIAQDALHKMAEDAVTIGLSYNDWDKIGCVNHDCDKCKAVQEPVAYEYGDDVFWHDSPDINDYIRANGNALVYATPPAPQPVPVKTYHDGKPWPVAPKPWVGLSEKEVEAYDSWADFQVGCGRQTLFDMVRDIDAKLKEKNT
jgi:hypothetical protein